MRKLVRSFVAVLAVLVLNGFGFVGHTAAMPMHGMEGMNHDQTNATSCATLCRTAVVDSKEQHAKNTQKENDDEPFFPFYLQLQNQSIDESLSLTKTCQSSIKPPPKVPIYILHCVSRS